MKSGDFMSIISNAGKDNETYECIRRGLPLGVDMVEQLILSQKREKPLTIRHTCVTGVGRSGFIRRLMITLSVLFNKTEACFFVLSPHNEYGEMLRLKALDVTVPYIRTKEDLALAVETLKELIRMREYSKGYPRLFLILDGLDELPDCNKNRDLEEYRDIFDLFNRNSDVEIISGSNLLHSIFSGEPGAFVGVGNCLVTTREEGKADVTYVQDDFSLSLPVPMHYPTEPSLVETIIYFNSVSREFFDGEDK